MTSRSAEQQDQTHLVDHSIRLPGGPLGILLIHGLGGTPVEMRYVAHGLARAGHTVHVPQLAGHCGSVDDLKITSWNDWYASVETEHRLLRETCSTVVVGGLSMGAIMALHHAAQHPRDVSAVALYSPCLWLDGWAIPWYYPLFNLIIQRWVADLFAFAESEPWGVKDPRVRAIIKRSISSGDSSRAGIANLPGGQLLEFRWLMKQVKQEIARVQQPALIIHPRDDDRASLRNLEYLQTHLGGSNESVVLDDSYHIVTIDRQRQLVVDRTLTFISRINGSPVFPVRTYRTIELIT